MLRRALALGAGLVILVLIVLGIKGCLNARKQRALSDYARNVTQIVNETEQISKGFFSKLSEPGELSVTEFNSSVSADRSAIDNFANRVNSLDAPGDMGRAQGSLKLVYELRSGAMNEIADQISTALGNVGSAKATKAIADQMEKLLASDVVYQNITRHEINRVLADNGIEGDEVPPSVFLPETKWLDETTVSSALSGVSGATGAATPGVHGLGLLGTSINGTELVPETTTAVAVEEETPEVEVEVQNQGESTENGVTVSVSVSGGGTLDQTISSIGVEETQSVTIPLVPAPTGNATLEVEVKSVPGEQVTSNNEASYTVEFE